MARITCDTLSRTTGKPIVGSTSEWSAVWPDAAISAAIHDMSEFFKERVEKGGEEIPAGYIDHLSDWLKSGDDITIMTLFDGEEMDVWQYDDERD